MSTTTDLSQIDYEKYIGKNADDVLDSLGLGHLKDENAVAGNVTKDLQNNYNKAMATKSSEQWYAGSGSLTGAVRGTFDATIYFGSSIGDMSFHGTMWTGPIAVGGGGGGPFASIPRDGQKMDFIWFGGAVTGGGVGIFWKINGVIVAGMDIAVAGLGAGGGSGSGTWKKG